MTSTPDSCPDSGTAAAIDQASADRAVAGALAAAGARQDAERDATMRAEAEGLGRPHEALRGLVPSHQLTSVLRHIERMAYQGMTGLQIAGRLGIDVNMLAWCAERFQDVRVALVGGATRGTDELSAAAMRHAVAGGNAGLISTMLKVKHGYHEPKEAAPAVVVNVGAGPAPVTLEHAGTLADRQAELLRLAGPEREASGPT